MLDGYSSHCLWLRSCLSFRFFSFISILVSNVFLELHIGQSVINVNGFGLLCNVSEKMCNSHMVTLYFHILKVLIDAFVMKQNQVD